MNRFIIILFGALVLAAPASAQSPMDILKSKGVIDNCRTELADGYSGPFADVCGSCLSTSLFGVAQTLTASCLNNSNNVQISTLWTDNCYHNTIHAGDGWLKCECKPGKKLMSSPVNGNMCG